MRVLVVISVCLLLTACSNAILSWKAGGDDNSPFRQFDIQPDPFHFVPPPFGGGIDKIKALILDPNGPYLYSLGDLSAAAGAGSLVSDIMRLRINGMRDPTFRATALPNYASCGALEEGSSGRIYVGGNFTNYHGKAEVGPNLNKPISKLIRLNADGSLDESFAPSITNPAIPETTVNAVATVPNETHIFIGGSFSIVGTVPCEKIARLDANGNPDSTFCSRVQFNNTVETIFVASDGRVYVGAASPLLRRMDGSGMVDMAFPKVSLSGNYVSAVAVDPLSGDIYVGGLFTVSGYPTMRNLIRLNSEGELDTSFADDGIDKEVRSIILASDGTGAIYVGGAFDRMGTVPIAKVIRLLPNGEIDPSFQVPPNVFNQTVWTIKPAGDNTKDIFVAGNFSPSNPTLRYLLRLREDGSIR